MTTNKKSKEGEWLDEIVTLFVRAAWRWRTELLMLIIVAAAATLADNKLGNPWGLLVVGLAVGIVLAVGRSRDFLRKLLYVSKIKRRWILAADDAQLRSHIGNLPTAKKVYKTPVGDELVVKVPRGSCVEDIEKQSSVLASNLGARQVNVERIKASAAYARVVVVWQEAFDEMANPWPVSLQEMSLWNQIPVGLDENGQTVSVGLPEKNILIGGEPGSGKSVAQSILVAAAALDPNVKLWLFDGKMVELAWWRDIAEANVGADPEHAIEVLKILKAEMEDRYLQLLDRGKRKIAPQDNLAFNVVVVDELAYYLNITDRKVRNELSELLRDLVSRGRAAGIIVIAATQKPSHEIVPTALRDLFGFRWAMRCNTWQASDTILGAGWGSLGFSADDIPSYLRGVGYLHTEGEQPIKVKSFYLADEDLEEIVAYAKSLRSEVGNK